MFQIKKELSRNRKLALPDNSSLKWRYKRARNKYISEIRKSKRQSWIDFIKKNGNTDPWGIVYKVLRGRIKESGIFSSITLQDGSYITSWKESIKVVLDKILPKDETSLEFDVNQEIRQKVRNYSSQNLEPDITLQEINNAIIRIKNKKVPGLDEHKAEAIKVIWKYRPEVFVDLFNSCLRNECFPKRWKTANLKLIL